MTFISCCCGCEGCDDYTVDVSVQGNSVVWFDWRADSEYIFDKSEYEKAIEVVRMNHYRQVEKHVPDMLRHTTTKEQYVFNWASVTSKENVITLNYSKPHTKQPDTVQKMYEIEWSENDKWNIEKIKPRIQRFIRRGFCKRHYKCHCMFDEIKKTSSKKTGRIRSFYKKNRYG